MNMGFAKTALDLSHEDWLDIERYNACLERLSLRRKAVISPTGFFAASKTAWKCALLQQAFLYRITMLARGTADMWNVGNVACSFLAARALIETIAAWEYLTQSLAKSVRSRNFEGIDDLANKYLFATRQAGLIATGAGFQATNIMTFIDRMTATIPSLREHYEFISEWCHPNGSGHFFTYGDLDKTTGTVHFSERFPRLIAIQSHVIASFMMILFTEQSMNEYDELIPEVAKTS